MGDQNLSLAGTHVSLIIQPTEGQLYWLASSSLDAEVPKNSQRLFMVTDPLRHRLRPSSLSCLIPAIRPARPALPQGPEYSKLHSQAQIQSARKPSFPSSPPPPTGLRSHTMLFCSFPKFVHKERRKTQKEVTWPQQLCSQSLFL